MDRGRRSPIVRCGIQRGPRPSGFAVLIARAAVSRSSLASSSHATVCLRRVPNTTVPIRCRVAGISGARSSSARSTTGCSMRGAKVMVMCGVWCWVGKPRCSSAAKISRTCASCSSARCSRMFSGDVTAFTSALPSRSCGAVTKHRFCLHPTEAAAHPEAALAWPRPGTDSAMASFRRDEMVEAERTHTPHPPGAGASSRRAAIASPRRAALASPRRTPLPAGCGGKGAGAAALTSPAGPSPPPARRPGSAPGWVPGIGSRWTPGGHPRAGRTRAFRSPGTSPGS